MSTYVMGDIHGNLYAYQKMLRNIKFSKDDTLYIIGDIIDRGLEPIKLVKKVMNSSNVIILLGNHEEMMQEYHRTLDVYDKYLWLENGGGTTIYQFNRLSQSEKDAILSWIRNLPLTIEITINNQKYILGHACPYGKTKREIIWSRIHPNQDTPQGNEIYICGHTPVLKYSKEKERVAKITKSSDARTWFIDCGCAYGDDKRARLACIRLEDGKEFYCTTFPKKHYEKKEMYEMY